MRKVFLPFLLALFYIFSACSGKDAVAGSKKSGIKKGDFNVLLITIDTLRFDRVGVYSDKYVKTPNIDKLAGESFLFTKGFSHNPVTLPSHTNIITGVTPLYHGISDNSGFALEDKFLTLAEHLKSSSYVTGAFIGAFPLDSRFGLDQGFDVYDDNYGTHNDLELFFVERKAEKVIDPALKWIEKRDGKWFCWVHLFDPHQPYLPPAPYDSEYSNDLYSGEVAYTDNELGKLFNRLREIGAYDKTVIVITGDHGEALGEKGETTHSYFAYNNTIHIPYIIKVPGMKGREIEENVSHIDIFPTVCDLLNINVPSHIQGESLVRLMEGGEKKEKYIYFESLTPYLNRGWAPLRGFIHGDDKFIDQPIREFYDLSKDMSEENNLIAKKNSGNLKFDLNKLILKLTGKEKLERAGSLDLETQKKLKSLGYFSGTTSKKKKVFTKADDLKTLLPLQAKMHRALAAHQSGNNQAAIRMMKEIIKVSPTYTLIYNNLAKIYKELRRTDQSVGILEQGLEKIPGDPFLLSKLGIFLVENVEYKRAINVLEQTVILMKHDPESFNYLGVAYYRSGNFEKAMENYNKSLEIDKNYASVYNNIGSLYLSHFQSSKDRRSYENATSNFNKALEIDENLYSALNGRGAARYFIGDFTGAISDWKRSVSAKPDFIDPYFSIGIAYLVKLRDKKSAYEYFKLCKDKFYNSFPEKEKERLDRLLRESSD